MSAIATSPMMTGRAVTGRSVTGVRLVGARRGAAVGRETSGTAVRGGLRLTTRGRVVLVLLGVLLATVLGLLLSPLLASGAVADGPTSTAVEVERHVVEPGETLWGIAAGIVRPGEDIRDVVLEVQHLNELPTAGLMAGQEILVPVR